MLSWFLVFFAGLVIFEAGPALRPPRSQLLHNIGSNHFFGRFALRLAGFLAFPNGARVMFTCALPCRRAGRRGRKLCPISLAPATLLRFARGAGLASNLPAEG